MELNESQKKALDFRRDIIVSAGAGSGKTRVLVERFLTLFMKKPSLSLENVAAITFTDKAAAELRTRISAGLYSFMAEVKTPETRMRLLHLQEELTRAYIGTIHSFCSRLLGEFPLEACVDAEFRILEEEDALTLGQESVDSILYSLAQNPESPEAEDLRFLLRYLGSRTIKSISRQMLSRRDIIAHHIKRYLRDSLENIMKADQEAGERLVPGKIEPDMPFERINACCVQSLARIFELIREEYERRKGWGSSLDFNDLLIKALSLVENNPSVRDKLRHRFHYFLVDEFQDTDPLQWRLFHLLSEGQKPGFLFLVGDPKQSIYGFRRADVRLFYKAQDFIRQKNLASGFKPGSLPQPESARESLGLLSLRENYRSIPGIVDFVNYFFPRIMPMEEQDQESFEVVYEPLSAQAQESGGGVEILYTDTNQVPSTDPLYELPCEELEGEFISRRIEQLLSPNASFSLKPRDIAILLRARTHLKSYEEALMRHGIPFMTVSGIGFYERQEIFDLANFLQFLVSPENDPRLLGLLRSPYLRMPDELIYKLAQREGRFLWERLQRPLSLEESLSDEETRQINRALDLLKDMRFKSQRMPLAQVLKEFLVMTGGWASLTMGPEGKRQQENVEKLLARARRFDASAFRSLVDFTEELSSLIENAEQEGEAPLPESDVDAVKIMTIHKAKGLEFPVVVLPGLYHSFTTLRTHFLMDDRYGLAITPANPESQFELQETVLFTALKQREQDKQLAEEKRLFYVAATRAEKILILSCARKEKINPHSRQAWLDTSFSFQDLMSSGGILSFEIESHSREIPVYTIDSFPAIQNQERKISEKTPEESREERDSEEAVLFKEKSISLLCPLPKQPCQRTLSVTHLNEFNRCPVKYYFTRLLGWKEETLGLLGLTDVRGEETNLPHQESRVLRGIIIHRLLQEMPFSREAAPDAIIATLLEEHSEFSLKEREELRKDVLKAWKLIASRDRIQRLASLKERRSELPFHLSFGLDVVQGRVDLCYLEDETWAVLDFKTGWVSSQGLEDMIGEYEIQMNAYSLFLSLFAPEQGKWPVHLYYVEPDKIATRVYEKSELSSLREKIQRLILEERNFSDHYAGSDSLYNKKTLEQLLEKTCSSCLLSSKKQCDFHFESLLK